jgi:hypothetical protein
MAEATKYEALRSSRMVRRSACSVRSAAETFAACSAAETFAALPCLPRNRRRVTSLATCARLTTRLHLALRTRRRLDRVVCRFHIGGSLKIWLSMAACPNHGEGAGMLELGKTIRISLTQTPGACEIRAHCQSCLAVTTHNNNNNNNNNNNVSGFCLAQRHSDVKTHTHPKFNLLLQAGDQLSAKSSCCSLQLRR